MFLSPIPSKGPGISGIKLLVLSRTRRGQTESLKKINNISRLAHYASPVPVPRADGREAQAPENTKWETLPPFPLGISTKTSVVVWEREMHTPRHLIHHQVKDSALAISGVGQVADLQALSMTNALQMTHSTKRKRRKNEILWAHELK